MQVLANAVIFACASGMAGAATIRTQTFSEVASKDFNTTSYQQAEFWFTGTDNRQVGQTPFSHAAHPSGAARPLFLFNLPSLGGQPLTSAHIEFYYANIGGASKSLQIHGFNAASLQTSQAVTNNLVGTAGVSGSPFGFDAPRLLSIQITSFIQQSYNQGQGQAGFMFRLDNEGAAGNWLDVVGSHAAVLGNSTGANRPTLVIQTADPAALSLSTNTVAFGDVLVGHAAPTQTLTVTNSGGSTLTGSISGGTAEVAVVSPSISTTTTSGHSVSFTPNARDGSVVTQANLAVTTNGGSAGVTVTGRGVAPVLDLGATADLDGNGAADVPTAMAEIGDALGAGKIMVQGRRGQVQRFGLRLGNTGDGQRADTALGRLDAAIGAVNHEGFSGAGGRALLGDGSGEAFTYQFRARRNGTFTTTVNVASTNGSPDQTNQGFSHNVVLEGTTEGQGSGIGGTIQFGTLFGGGVAVCNAAIRYQTANDDQNCAGQIIQTNDALPLADQAPLLLQSAVVTAADASLAAVFRVDGFAANTLFDEDGDSLGVTISLDLWAARSWLLGQGITTGQVPIAALLEVTATDSFGQTLLFGYDLSATLDAASIVPAPGMIGLVLGGLLAIRCLRPAP